MSVFVSSCAAAAAAPAKGSAIVVPAAAPPSAQACGEPLRPVGPAAQSSSMKQNVLPRAARAPRLRAAAGPAPPRAGSRARRRHRLAAARRR